MKIEFENCFGSPWILSSHPIVRFLPNLNSLLIVAKSQILINIRLLIGPKDALGANTPPSGPIPWVIRATIAPEYQHVGTTMTTKTWIEIYFQTILLT